MFLQLSAKWEVFFQRQYEQLAQHLIVLGDKQRTARCATVATPHPHRKCYEVSTLNRREFTKLANETKQPHDAKGARTRTASLFICLKVAVPCKLSMRLAEEKQYKTTEVLRVNFPSQLPTSQSAVKRISGVAGLQLSCLSGKVRFNETASPKNYYFSWIFNFGTHQLDAQQTTARRINIILAEQHKMKGTKQGRWLTQLKNFSINMFNLHKELSVWIRWTHVNCPSEGLSTYRGNRNEASSTPLYSKQTALTERQTILWLAIWCLARCLARSTERSAVGNRRQHVM